ncbi:MAG: glycosyltransferase family 39 protein [Patescibacteria group bacterium]
MPGSFLGLPLFYGVLGKIFGTWIIYYIGPLLASLSVFFFYLFIKKIFTDKIAFISSLILFTQPIFIFYAMRPFWHNGLFVSFLIIASYFLLRIINEKKWRDYLLFGIFLGLSLAIRTSELVWILFSVIAFLGINYKKINRKYLIISLFSFIIILAPLFYYQYQTYGNALTTSYTRGLFEGTSASNDGNSSAFQILSKIFLPFGYKPELFLKTFYNYSFKLMFPWFTLAIFGLVIILKRFWQTRDNKKILFYSLWFLGVSLWLMVFYGSLKFVEYINEESILIGISYARYWLPIYIFCLPLTVVFTLYISEKIIPEVRKLSLVLLVALIIFVGIFQIFLDPYYGVQETKTNFLAEAKTKLYFALEKTEKNAIIIAGVSDKIYWPERRVIGYNGTIMPTDILVKIKSLSEISPVYYDCSTSSEIQRVNNYLYERELNFKPVAADSNFYVLSKIKNDNL